MEPSGQKVAKPGCQKVAKWPDISLYGMGEVSSKVGMKTTPAPKKKKATIIRREWPKVRDLNPAGKKLFVVDARPYGRREGYATKEDALTRAEQLALEIENKGTESVAFPTEARIMAAECIRRLEPFGKNLRDATDHYVAWLKSEKHKNESRLVSLCIADYEAARTLDVERGDFAAKSLNGVKTALRPLNNGLGGLPIMAVTEEKIMTLLDSMRISARSRLNYRTGMSAMFNFCRRKGWIEKNPVEDIAIKVKSAEVRVLTVEQSKILLRAAAASKEAECAVPYAAICLFTGLRPGEAEQLRWEQIHFDTDTIEVLSQTSKTRDGRFVPIEPTLRVWLELHKKTTGRIIGTNFRNVWRAVKAMAAKAGGLDFMHKNYDVLRHTYASYWLPIHKNRTELAEHMGNSVGVIKKHYRRPILETTAKAFWSLTPEVLK